MSDEKIEDSGTPEGFLEVEATGAGGSPVNAAGRSWKKGEKGVMEEREALARIEHGLFKAVDKAAHAGAVERRQQEAIARAEEALEEQKAAGAED